MVSFWPFVKKDKRDKKEEQKQKEENKQQTAAKDLMILILTTLQEIYYPLNIIWWKALIFFTGTLLGGLGVGYIIGLVVKIYALTPAPAPAPIDESPITTATITFAPPPW